MAFMCAAILCLKLFLLICLQPTMGLDISWDITPTPMGQNTTECADQGMQTGSLPHPSQCDKFFLCTNGDTELVSCPNGLAFNTHIKSCDYRVNVPECINGNELKTVKQELEDMTEKYHSMSQKMEGMSQELDELRKKASLVSAFSAHPKTAYSKDFKGRMVFDEVQYKLGPGYDATTGKFKAPTRGLYAFHLTVGSIGEDVARVGIFVKSREVSRLWVASDELDGQSSTSTVVELKAEDVVQVRKTSGEARLEDGVYSTFSGYLVKAL